MNISASSPFVRRVCLSLALLLMAATLAPCAARTDGSSARQQKPQPAINAIDIAQRIHAKVNEQRVKHGLAALAWNVALARIAAGHSRDMAGRNYLGHDGPDGESFADRYRQGGFSCQVRVGRVIHAGAENVALSRLYNSVTTVNGVKYYDWNSAQQIADRTVEGWMQSPGHRKNILTPHWRREGIGVEVRPDNKVYITQNFC